MLALTSCEIIVCGIPEILSNLGIPSLHLTQHFLLRNNGLLPEEKDMIEFFKKRLLIFRWL